MPTEPLRQQLSFGQPSPYTDLVDEGVVTSGRLTVLVVDATYGAEGSGRPDVLFRFGAITSTVEDDDSI